MDPDGQHHVARIDDTVTKRNLHELAEAVAVPDFNYLEQCACGITAGLSWHRHHAHDAADAPGGQPEAHRPATGR
jgi:hypothetical protein